MTKIKLGLELRRFTEELLKLQSQGLKVEKVDEDLFKLIPSGSYLKSPLKDFGLCILAIVHGNEVGGLASLNDFLAWLALKPNRLPFPIAVGLGNVAAANQGTRYVEKDLNRSFQAADRTPLEARRAQALEGILDRSLYLIDIHQTTEPGTAPFYIFPYTAEGYQLARFADPRLPIVTHWGDSFSAEGMCSDEYMNQRGGFGITIELGQNGFNPYGIAAGFKVLCQSLDFIEMRLSGLALPALAPAEELYTWGKVIAWPAQPSSLVPGLHNFQKVLRGEHLGEIDGIALQSPLDGAILFPKYLRGTEKKPPTELIRFMRRISESDLGKDLK